MNDNPKKWKLINFNLQFKSGYNFEKTVDRYEGMVTFQNKDSEQFTLKITPVLSALFIKLITNELAVSVNELSLVVLKSLQDVTGGQQGIDLNMVTEEQT